MEPRFGAAGIYQIHGHRDIGKPVTNAIRHPPQQRRRLSNRGDGLAHFQAGFQLQGATLNLIVGFLEQLGPRYHLSFQILVQRLQLQRHLVENVGENADLIPRSHRHMLR